MKNLFLLSSVLIGVMLVFLGVGSSVIGLVLAFSSSWLLGFIVLLVEPLPLIFGLAKLFAHVDLAAQFIHYLSANGIVLP